MLVAGFGCYFKLHKFLNFQVLPGCGCCEVNGKLVVDKQTWIVDGKTYGKKIKRICIVYLFLYNIFVCFFMYYIFPSLLFLFDIYQENVFLQAEGQVPIQSPNPKKGKGNLASGLSLKSYGLPPPPPTPTFRGSGSARG